MLADALSGGERRAVVCGSESPLADVLSNIGIESPDIRTDAEMCDLLALLDEEEEERKQAARKKQLHQQLDQQLQDKTVAVFSKKADVVEEREAVDAIIHQVYFSLTLFK